MTDGEQWSVVATPEIFIWEAIAQGAGDESPSIGFKAKAW